MLRVRKILFPTDFSEPSRLALDQALMWAEVQDAELLLLHVIATRAVDLVDPEARFPEPAEISARVKELANSELAKLVAAHQDRPLRLRQMVRSATDVDEGILETARAENVDLVIIGTHGRRGAARLLMGSVAAEVLRRSDRAVLVVPARGRLRAGRLRRILAPVDFSEPSKRAVAEARALAAAAGAQLELFHALPNFEVPLPMNPGGFGGASAIVADLEPAARAALADLATATGPPARIETELWQGPPASTILNRAEATEADLIVLASHGYNGLDRLLLGSVTEKVARLAHCPVLVLPPKLWAVAAAA
jgi:nucleotide-binding universal stress UspA family protein